MFDFLLGCCVFVGSLLTMLYLKPIILYTTVTAQFLRPYDYQLTLLMVVVAFVAAYFWANRNKAHKKTLRFANHRYDTVDEFERRKKEETRDALRHLMQSPQYNAYLQRRRLNIEKPNFNHQFDCSQFQREIKQNESEIFDN